MKKFLAMLLAIMLCLSMFAACDSKKNDDDRDHKQAESTTDETSEIETVDNNSTPEKTASESETTETETGMDDNRETTEKTTTESETTGIGSEISELETTETETEPINDSEGLEFTSNGDGTCYVSGIGNYKKTDVVIPTVDQNGNTVTKIGEKAFSDCNNIETVIIPYGVKTIGARAFSYCENLTSVVIPESVTVIEKGAFSSCSNMERINIPNSVCHIGMQAFYSCEKLKSIILSDSITSIEEDTFYGCSSLKQISIPSSVSIINEDAFKDCCMLIEVYNESDLAITQGSLDNGYVGYYAKNIYTNLEGKSMICVKDDFVFFCDEKSNDNILLDYNGNDKVLELPENINDHSYRIYPNAFANNNNITDVIISNGVTKIGYNAFSNCHRLTRLTISSSVIEIEKGYQEEGYFVSKPAFSKCYRLVEINNYSDIGINIGGWDGFGTYAIYENNDPSATSRVSIIGDYVVYCDPENNDYRIIDYIGNNANISLPESINGYNYMLNHYAFFNLKNIQAITISRNVTSIGTATFYNCTKLANIAFEDGSLCESIGDGAFANNSYLSSITLPDSIISMGSELFCDCTSIKQIIIPKNIKTIDSSSFYNCTSLETIYYTGTEEEWAAIEGVDEIPTTANIIYNYVPEE